MLLISSWIQFWFLNVVPKYLNSSTLSSYLDTKSNSVSSLDSFHLWPSEGALKQHYRTLTATAISACMDLQKCRSQGSKQLHCKSGRSGDRKVAKHKNSYLGDGVWKWPKKKKICKEMNGERQREESLLQNGPETDPFTEWLWLRVEWLIDTDGRMKATPALKMTAVHHSETVVTISHMALRRTPPDGFMH
jgi:hypothetical protein